MPVPNTGNSVTPAPARKVGEWWVDPATNELRRDGETLRLESKAIEVLVYLADRPGRVVGRNELLAALWPGVVVSDDTLTQAIIKLRKALGDSARTPAYIETISKRGYRLIARIEGARPDKAESPETGDTGQQAAPVAAPPRERRRPWFAAGATVALAILVVASALYYQATQDDDSWLSQHLSSVDEFAAGRLTAALPTVAVAPFEAFTHDADQAYLAGGITSDLTTDLSRLSGLRVVSASKIAGPTPDAGVPARYTVSGTVQRLSGRLKVNVRLVDNQSGQQLWAERYERSLGDPFAMNEEIIERVLAALSVQIKEAERRRLAGRYTRKLDAYDYFLRGQAAYLARQGSENQIAREMYRKAIELDPAFGRAYVSLALTHAADYQHQWTADGRQALARAAELAETAIRIDPQLPDPHGVLAYVRNLQGRSEQGIAHLKRALALDPFYADGYAYLGATYSNIGQNAKTVRLLRTAMRLNPDAGFIYFLVLGRAYLFEGDTEQALINLREALTRNAADLESRVFMTATLVAAGDLGAARWETVEIRSLQPEFNARRWLETHPISDTRQRERLESLLAQVGL